MFLIALKLKKFVIRLPFFAAKRLPRQRRVKERPVHDFILSIKIVPDWFVTCKMIKKLHNTLFTDDDIRFQ